MSKKDCRCFFDQFALPPAIQPWTGRPPVSVAELLTTGGTTFEEIASFLPGASRLRSKDVFFPVKLSLVHWLRLVVFRCSIDLACLLQESGLPWRYVLVRRTANSE